MDIFQAIPAEIERLQQEYILSLQKLIKVRSVIDETSEQYPFGESINQALVTALEICEKLGFQTYYNPDGYYGYAEVGTGKELIGILGHVDVVPEGRLEDWDTPPFEAVLKDGRMYGRGTQDDKGPTLAAVFAVKALMNLGVVFNSRIRIIFGTDEETLWRCMNHYRQKEELPSMGFTPDSTFPLVYAEKGLLQFLLKGKNRTSIRIEGGDAFNAVPSSIQYTGVKQAELEQKLNELNYAYEKNANDIVILGKPAHAQVPEEGVNAITHLAVALYEIGIHSKLIDFIYEVLHEDVFASNIFGEVQDDVSGKLKFNIGKIAIQEEEEVLSVDMRIPVTADKEDLVGKLIEKARTYRLEYEEFDFLHSIYVPLDSPLVQTLMKVYQDATGDIVSQPISSGGATYARAMNNCVAFGAIFPGQEKVEHQPNEYIELEKMYKAVEIYAKAIFELSR